MRSHEFLPAFTRRSLLRGLGAAAALPILAACQSQVEVTRVVEKPVEKQVEVTRVVEKPVEKQVEVTRVVEKPVEKVVTQIVAAPRSPVTLFLLNCCGPINETQPIFKLARAYEQANPQLKIEALGVPPADLYTKIETGWVSGTGPDLAFTGGATKRYIHFGWGLEMDPYLPMGDKQDFYPVALDLVSRADRMYSMPFSTHAQPLFFRKDLLEGAGVDWRKIPETWDDLLGYAQKATKKTGDSFDVMGIWLGPYNVHLTQGFVYGNGGGWVEDDDSVWIDKPETIEAVQWVADWGLKYGVAPKGGASEQIGGQNLAAGKVAIQHTTAGVTAIAREQGKDELIGAWPMVKGKLKRAAMSYHNNYMVHSRSKARDDVASFAVWLTSTDQMVALNAPGRNPMPRKSAVAKADWMKDPRFQLAQEAGGIYGENEGKSPYAIPVRDNELSPNIDKVWLGQMTAKEAMTAAAKGARDYIASEKAKEKK